MKTLYSVSEAAYRLDLTVREVRELLYNGELEYTCRIDAAGNDRYYIPVSEVNRYREEQYARSCDREFAGKYRIIKVEMTLEVPDEWYDEDYHRIRNRARSMYERQLIDDLY